MQAIIKFALVVKRVETRRVITEFRWSKIRRKLKLEQGDVEIAHHLCPHPTKKSAEQVFMLSRLFLLC
jgi:hypothetical protein